MLKCNPLFKLSIWPLCYSDSTAPNTVVSHIKDSFYTFSLLRRPKGN